MWSHQGSPPVAVETAVKQGIRLVLDLFREYASARGWGPEDYRLYVWPNPDWFALHFLLVVRDYPHGNYDAAYDEILDFLESRLKDNPELFRMVGLSLLTFAEVEQRGEAAIAP